MLKIRRMVIILFLSFFTLAGNSLFAETERVVYVVPDLSTFLYWIGEWDVDYKFPVFIGKDEYVEKFIFAFKAEKIIYSKPVNLGKVDKTLVYNALYASWGPEGVKEVKNVNKNRLKERLKRLQIKPKGIVFTNLESEELAGGIALACGRKQLLDFYNPGLPYAHRATSEEKEVIRKKLISRIKDWGYAYKELGDEIDYITLALDIPYRYQNGYSLDDAINRLEPKNETCFAYVGRLLGIAKPNNSHLTESNPPEADNSAGRSMPLYQAMCSLFLRVDKALFFDRWPDKWQRRTSEAAWEITDYVPALQVAKQHSSLKRWREIMKGGNSYPFVYINTSGPPTRWGDATTEDIPDSVPSVVIFAHSNSAADPKNKETIAGRWLANGAYVYYGAISEPYNASFSRPLDFINSFLRGSPLAAACEKKENLQPRFRLPWKLIYIGDPLCRPQLKTNPDETNIYWRIKEALSPIKDGKIRSGAAMLEKITVDFHGYSHLQEIWPLLKKSYELLFLEKLYSWSPIDVYVTRNFLRKWYLDIPSHPVELNKQLRSHKEIVYLYEKLLEEKGRNQFLARNIKKEIGFLEKAFSESAAETQ